jgi:hypothetical protein
LSEQTYRERWRREVYKTTSVSDAVRVALLALADDMDDSGMVSVGRPELAGKLARSDRRIGERLTSAISAGLLERVSRGQRNGRGRYRAALPGDPSSGRTGVPKTAGVFRTDGGPEEDSLQDGLQVEETSGLQDGRGSSRSVFDPSVFGTPGCPEEAAPYRGTARAHSRSTHSDHRTPPESGTDTTTPDETTTRVSQSSRKREAFRWLAARYRLTEFECAAVMAEVTARAPREIRSPVRYLESMKEGDLADIVAAVLNRTDNTETRQPEPDGHEKPASGRPPWCGQCHEPTRMVDLLDGRVARCPACHPLREESA